MPRGQPDYGNPNYSISQVAFDPSLFLTAMKGINSVNGKGRVWKIDNFNDGLGAWIGDNGGDAQLPVMSTDNPEVGSVSVKMNGGTLAGSGSSNLAAVFILNSPQRLGFEAGIYLDNLSPVYYLSLDYRIANNSFNAVMRIQESDRTIAIYTPTGYVTLVTLDTSTFTPGWIPVKMTVDFLQQKYVSVVYGNVSIDVSQYSLRSIATLGIGSAYFTIEVIPNANNNTIAYIGHTIITLDEP